MQPDAVSLEGRRAALAERIRSLPPRSTRRLRLEALAAELTRQLLELAVADTGPEPVETELKWWQK